MEKKPPRPMTPFDELTIPSELQTLKLLLPYTPASGQHFIWIFIKFIELQHTIQIFQSAGNKLHTQTFQHFYASPADILEEISPYLSPEEAGMIDTFRNVMNIMEMMQMFQENSAASENTPEAESADSGSPDADSANTDSRNSFSGFGGMNPMDLLMGMFSPEQQEMFQMYQSMFSDIGSGSPDPDNSGEPVSDNRNQEGEE